MKMFDLPGGNGKSLRSELTRAALGENNVKFASTYLLTRDREFQVSAGRLVDVMSVIFREVQKGAVIQEVVAKNLFGRAQLLVRENHGKSADELSVSWNTTDFVLECNHAFLIPSSDEAVEAWRRRPKLILCEGDFTTDPKLVNIDKGVYLADPGLDSWVSSGVAGYIRLTRGILPIVEQYTDKQTYDKLDKPSAMRQQLNEEFLDEMTGSGSAGDRVPEEVDLLDVWQRTSMKLVSACLEDLREPVLAQKDIALVARLHQSSDRQRKRVPGRK